jgi:hypothetical protein
MSERYLIYRAGWRINSSGTRVQVESYAPREAYVLARGGVGDIGMGLYIHPCPQRLPQ